MEFNHIGYFQLDNLIQCRVPMVLIVLDNLPLETWYKHVAAMHLKNVMISAKAEDVLNIIAEKNLPSHYAIVILDNDASTAPGLVSSLEKKGHLNAYYITGGWQGISKERAENS